jgi:hypothetical protein
MRAPDSNWPSTHPPPPERKKKKNFEKKSDFFDF